LHFTLNFQIKKNVQDGDTSLMLVAKHGNIAAAKVLLEGAWKADINSVSIVSWLGCLACQLFSVIIS
jgi:hypothetical protein